MAIDVPSPPPSSTMTAMTTNTVQYSTVQACYECVDSIERYRPEAQPTISVPPVLPKIYRMYNDVQGRVVNIFVIYTRYNM